MTVSPACRRCLPWWKRWLFRGVALSLALAVLELLTAGIWWFSDADTSAKDVRDYQQSVMTTTELPHESTEAIHPYLGWVLDPQAMTHMDVGGAARPLNKLGFLDDGPGVQKRDPHVVLVGITGGSVAMQLSWMGAATLSERLEADPAFAGKQVKFVRLALSGYKQPQQLMAMNYLLALGGELDYLINIDGYNELALSVEENYVHQTSMAYPRMWDHRLQDVVDPRLSSVSAQLLILRGRRQTLASLVARSWLRHSRTANYLWLHTDRWLQRRQYALGNQVRIHQETHGHSFARSGPANSVADENAAVKEAIQLWARCSRQLHQVCQANDIRYLHVVQPNRHHAGSKPLNEQEQSQCMATNRATARLIESAYPLVVAAGKRLRDEAIPVCDLTQLFAAETDTIYSDCCCHFNQRGNILLAEAIAEALLKDR